ncbi:MAG: nicotinate-nicotinamide nucleotide adenylyltransferase [Proteobacteria bacterium]|nr:nicotinate-nicotinamide nucleotide adenylyltransferase [Pseudomonadota bacterium]
MSTSFQRHVALFGGAFNPPHLGHREAIQGLRSNPGVARVVVVPSRGTPLKTVTTSYEERLEMAKIAFQGAAEVSDLEGLHAITYTWELLERTRTLGENRAFVIGTDQFVGFRSWQRFPEILSMCDWIVLLRKPAGIDAASEMLRTLQADGVLESTSDPMEWRVRGRSQGSQGTERVIRFVETVAQEISSTRIRENFALGKKNENQAWMAPAVMEWIERKHLYGT